MHLLDWAERMTAGMACSTLVFGLIASLFMIVNALALKRNMTFAVWLLATLGVLCVPMAITTSRMFRSRALLETEAAIRQGQAAESSDIGAQARPSLERAQSMIGWLALGSVAFGVAAGAAAIMSAVLLSQRLDGRGCRVLK